MPVCRSAMRAVALMSKLGTDGYPACGGFLPSPPCPGGCGVNGTQLAGGHELSITDSAGALTMQVRAQ